MPIQLEVLKDYDFGEGQLGLSRFNETYALCVVESIALLQLNKQKWLFIFEKAFDFTEFKEISLLEAQRLIASIAEEMVSEVFLEQVDEAINSLRDEGFFIGEGKFITRLTVI